MPTNILALDVGSVRIGLAIGNDIVRLASPLAALSNDATLIEQLQALVKQHEVQVLVVGWPRGLDGQMTAQTNYVADFIKRLTEQFALPIHKQDEALTSRQAEQELQARGKAYDKAAIDSLSATYILEDYFNQEVH